MSVTFTTRGYIEVRRDGEFISRHRVETEAIESALTHAGTAGNGRYTLHFPPKDIDVLIQARRDITPPPQVLGVTAVANSASQITVSWSAASDATGIAYYMVERSTDNVNWAQVGSPTGTSFVDGGLTASTLYRYRILAVDGDQNVGVIYSGTVSATTQSGSQPTTPPFQWTIPDEPYPLGDVQQGATVSLASLYSVDTGVTPEFTVVSGDTDRLSINSATGAITVAAGAPLGTATIRIFGGEQGAAAGDFEPVITGEAQGELYRTIDYSTNAGLGGVSYSHYNRRLGLEWVNPNVGDYIGRTSGQDVAQGGDAFHTASIGAAGQYHPVTVTDVIARAVASGRNKGIYLRMTGTGASVTWAGRLSSTPPLLSVTTNVGTYNCPCLLSSNVMHESATAFPYNSTLLFYTQASARYGIVQFDLSAVVGTVVTATMQLYASAVFGSGRTLHVFELNPPTFVVGAGAATPELGLAAEVGESNLPSHPDVYSAGDFTGTTLGSGAATGVPWMNGGTVNFENSAQIVDDLDAPGTRYWRGECVNVVSGSANRSVLIARRQFILPDTSDPAYPVDMATHIDELYLRCYFMYEPDFLDQSEGIKMGLNFDARLGYWNPAGNGGLGEWQQDGGNSDSYGDGMAHYGDCHDDDGTIFPALYYTHSDRSQWTYKGQMNWNQGGFTGTPGDPNWNVRPMRTYNYNIDMSDVFADGQRVLGNVVPAKVRLGRWYCLEQYMKLNTLDLAQPLLDKNGSLLNSEGEPYENYEANADGILRTWLNGVLIDEQTNFRWRRNAKIGIRAAGMEWYVGGNGATSWAQPMHFRVNHVAMARRYIGPRVRPATSQPSTILSQQAAALSGAGWLMESGSVKDIGPLLGASVLQSDGRTVLQRASGTVLNDWCGHLCYDHIGRQIINYMGGVGSSTSTASSYRVRFDEAANAWSKLQNPFPGTVGTYDGMPTGHGYYSNAIDAAGRRMWRMNFFTDSAFTSVALKEVNLDTLAVQAERPRTGGTLPQGLAYLPGRDWLISTFNGQIRRLDVSTTGTSWVDLSAVSSSYVSTGHTVAAQHPVTGRVLVGGGSTGSGVLASPGGFYEVNPDGTVNGPWAFPSGVYANLGGSTQSLVCADPASSGWVIFNHDRTIWTLTGGPSGGTWTNTGLTVPTTAPFSIQSGTAMNNRNAVALTGLGCILVLFNDFSNNAVKAALVRVSP